MRYASYKAKYAKKIQKLNVLYKLRFVFIGVGAAAVISTTTLLGVKGNVGKTTPTKDTYVYGEEININSSALMNGYEIEYAHKDKDDWSSQKPVKPGEYKARGVSKSGYGGTKVGKETYFSIVPADLHLPILSSKITYGDNPLLDLSEANKKNLKVDGISYSFGTKFDESDPFDGNATFKDDVALNTSSLNIIDENGLNLNDCYKVISETKKLDVEKRDIVVDFTSSEKTYDGETLVTNPCEINPSYSLAFSDELKCENLSSLEECGTAKATSDIKIVRGEVDKTAFYNISKNDGSLVVNKRKITIKTNSLTRYYNGRRVTAGTNVIEDKLSYEMSEDVLPSHKVVFQGFELEGTYITKTGAKENKIDKEKFIVVDKDNNPVESKYYDLTFESGLVNIMQFPLTIDFKAVTKFYDGEKAIGKYDLSYPTELEDVCPLGEGRTDTLTTGSLETENGELVDNLTYGQRELIKIHNNDLDVDVDQDCYALLVNTASLSIKKRKLTIKTNDIEKTEYDGDQLSSKETAKEKDKLEVWVEGDELDANHKLDFGEFSLEDKYITDGQEINSIAFNILDKNNNPIDPSLFDLYYDVTTEFGTADISKYALNITFDTNVTYDEKSQVNIPYDVDRDLPNAFDKLVVEQNVVDVPTKGEGDVVHSFIPDVKIYDKDNHPITTDYYNVNVTNGSDINFTQRDLHITTSAHYGEYDGKVYNSTTSVPGHKLTCTTNPGELAPGHELRPVFELDSITALKPDTYYNNLSSYKIVDTNDGDKDVTYRYKPAVIDVKTVVINKKHIDVSFSDLIKECDGNNCNPTCTYNGDDLAFGDTLECYIPYNANSVGYYNGSVRIYNSSLEDVTDCYVISDPNFVCINKPRPIKITSASINKSFDNEPLTKTDLNVHVDLDEGHSLLSNHKLFVDYYALEGIKDVKFDYSGNVDSYQNYFEYRIYDENTHEYLYSPSDYYDIDVDFGEVTIDKCPISITNIYPLSSKEVDYDALSHYFEESDFEGPLPTGCHFKPTRYSDPGTYSENLFTIENSDYQDITNFFDISLNSVKPLIINKINISYWLKEEGNATGVLTKEYDAQKINLIDYLQYETSAPLPSGYSVDLVEHNSSSELTRANSNPINFDYELKLKYYGYDVPSYERDKYFTLNKVADSDENIKPTTKLKINKKPIEFDQPALSKTYDGSALTRALNATDQLGLVGGDYIVSSTFDMTTQTSAASNVKILNTQAIKIRNASGQDVTDCYDFSNDFGTYTVNKRKITISLPDIPSRTYDGTSISDSEINSGKSVVGELALGESITLTKKENYKYVTDGFVSYEVEARIKRGTVDVTSNYDITFVGGTYKIDKRNVYATSVSLDKTFDGEEFDPNQLTDVIDVAETDYANVTFTGNVDGYNAHASQSNTFTVEFLEKDTNKNVDGQYNLLKTTGTVTIHQRVISFSVNDKTLTQSYTYSGGYQQVKSNVDLKGNSIPSYIQVSNSGTEYAEFKAKSDVSMNASFEYTDANIDIDNADVTYKNGTYSFYASGDYSFSCVVSVTVDGVTYSSDDTNCQYDSLDGYKNNIVFNNTSSGTYPSVLEYHGNKKALTLTTATIERMYFEGTAVANCEKIICSGLASGDTLYIVRGGVKEQYQKDKAEYNFLDFNGTFLVARTDPYEFGEDFKDYIDSIIIERKVGGQTIDVTGCYDIHFNFANNILIKVW